jgi:hypothetical protein
MAQGAGITREWSLATAHTDSSIVTVGASERAIVMFFQATLGEEADGNCSCRAGFGTTALPAVANDDLAGVLGVFFSHAAIPPGGGEVAANAGAVVSEGGPGQHIRITHSLVVNSFLRVVMTYRIITVDAGT